MTYLDRMLFSIVLSLQLKKSSGKLVSLRCLVALLQSSTFLTAQEVALVVLTIFTPFERTESSSLLINENRSLVLEEWLIVEAVEEQVDGRIAAVETGRVAKGVEERVELCVGGSTVEELAVDGRVASVEAGRVAKGVEVVELFVGGCIPVVPLIKSIISSQKNSLVIETMI